MGTFPKLLNYGQTMGDAVEKFGALAGSIGTAAKEAAKAPLDIKMAVLEHAASLARLSTAFDKNAQGFIAESQKWRALADNAQQNANATIQWVGVFHSVVLATAIVGGHMYSVEVSGGTDITGKVKSILARKLSFGSALTYLGFGVLLTTIFSFLLDTLKTVAELQANAILRQVEMARSDFLVRLDLEHKTRPENCWSSNFVIIGGAIENLQFHKKRKTVGDWVLNNTHVNSSQSTLVVDFNQVKYVIPLEDGCCFFTGPQGDGLRSSSSAADIWVLTAQVTKVRPHTA